MIPVIAAKKKQTFWVCLIDSHEHVKNIKLNPDILERNKINLRDDYLTEIKNLNLKIQLPEEGFMGFCFGTCTYRQVI